MKDNYSYKIENINYILIFLIVILHSSLSSFVSENSTIYSIFNFINVICDVAVPTFILISAYLFFRNFDYSKYFIKLKSRVKSLVIPYLLWSTITYFYYAICSNISFFKNIINSNFISLDFKTAIISIFTAKCDPPIWFIQVLVIFAIISQAIFFVVKLTNTKFKQVMMCILLSVIVLLFSPSYSAFIFWLPVYYIGAVFAVYYKRINLFKKNKLNIALLLSSFLIFLLLAFFCKNEKSPIYTMYRFISPFFILYVTDIDFFEKKYFKVLDSFFIFCVHVPIIQIVRKIYMKLLLPIASSTIMYIIIYVLTVLSTIFLIYLITLFMKKYMIKFYSLLNGNRNVSLNK